MKQYNLRCQYCGTDHQVNKTLLYLKLVLLGEVRSQCKACMRQSRHILVSHVVHDADTDERMFNHSIEEHKKENKVWVK